MDTAAQNLACGAVLQIFSPRPPSQRSSFLRPRRADRDPFRVFQAWPSETRGSGTILVSGADSLNPWERALKNRGAPAQGKPRGGNSCGAGSETRGVPEQVWLFGGFRLFISRDREVVNSPGSHPGDRWFKSNSRNQDFLRKEGASRLLLLSPAWPLLRPLWKPSLSS